MGQAVTAITDAGHGSWQQAGETGKRLIALIFRGERSARSERGDRSGHGCVFGQDLGRREYSRPTPHQHCLRYHSRDRGSIALRTAIARKFLTRVRESPIIMNEFSFTYSCAERGVTAVGMLPRCKYTSRMVPVNGTLDKPGEHE